MHGSKTGSSYLLVGEKVTGKQQQPDNENSVSVNAGNFFISRGTISFNELDGKKPNRLLSYFDS
jgi:hypothetical protein